VHVLREADVIIEDGPDPLEPRVTVRRARRCDPLQRLLAFGSICNRQFDAAERLRSDLEASMPRSANAGFIWHFIGTANDRLPLTEGQMRASTRVREAFGLVPAGDREMLVWMISGGSVVGYARYAHLRDQSVRSALRSVLDLLADHYFGAEVSA